MRMGNELSSIRSESCFKPFTVQAKLEVPQHPDWPENKDSWISLLSA